MKAALGVSSIVALGAAVYVYGLPGVYLALISIWTVGYVISRTSACPFASRIRPWELLAIVATNLVFLALSLAPPQLLINPGRPVPTITHAESDTPPPAGDAPRP